MINPKLYNLIFEVKFNIATFYNINRIRKKVIDNLRYSAGRTDILDIACGNSALIKKIPPRKGLYITALDMSEENLNISKINVCKDKKIGFIKANFPHINFKDKKFDNVIFSFFLHETNLTKIKESIELSKRLLKKDGRLIIADYSKTKFKALSLFYGLYFKMFEKHADEFINLDLTRYVKERGLKLLKEEKILFNSFRILVFTKTARQ